MVVRKALIVPAGIGKGNDIHTFSVKLPLLSLLSMGICALRQDTDMYISNTVVVKMAVAFRHSAILERTAKLIECNINYPNTRMAELAEESGKGGNWFQETFQRISWFFTKKGNDGEESSGEWKVDKTYTYVQVDADIEMKMFFLNTEFFTNLINVAYLEEGEPAPDTSATVTTYHYHSVMGY